EDLIKDPRFALYDARLANRDALQPIIHARMTQDTTAFWLQRLEDFDVPSAPILSIAEALEQDHVAQQGLVEEVSHPQAGDMKLVRGPIRFDGVGPAKARAPSMLGENTFDILSNQLGLQVPDIQELVARGVIKGLP
ncbi:unnamed protein product, partial [Laminaria digitata]